MNQRPRRNRFTSFVAAALAVVLAITFQTTVASATAAAPGCTSLAHIGDSTTVGMDAQIRAAYQAQGWADFTIDAGGGRAVDQGVYGDHSGLQAVVGLRAAGFSGCWVVALGTNDTAAYEFADGDSAAREQDRRSAIDRMMIAIGPSPVMWVNVHLRAPSGRYTEHAADEWDRVLAGAAADYPNLTIYDWDGAARSETGWLAGDGIHYSTGGSDHRALLIAAAATATFAPRDPESLGTGTSPSHRWHPDDGAVHHPAEATALAPAIRMQISE